jgi:solute carrier family 25, member 38
MPSSQRNAFASAASGALSGALVSVTLQPFDVVRTRMQADATAGAARSLLRTIRSVTDDGGVRNLWRGSSATVVRVGCGAGVHFYLLQLMRELKANRKRDDAKEQPLMSVLTDAAMGGSSRAIAVSLLCPITLVKTRMEASGAAAAAFAYRSVPEALVSIIRSEGVLAMWRGLIPALMTNVPFSTIHYVFYTQFQQMLQQRVEKGPASNFAAGAGASILATLLTQPFDVMRTRAMLSLEVTATAGMFAGLGPRLAKRSMQTALLWTMYEELWARWKRARAQYEARSSE